MKGASIGRLWHGVQSYLANGAVKDAPSFSRSVQDHQDLRWDLRGPDPELRPDQGDADLHYKGDLIASVSMWGTEDTHAAAVDTLGLKRDGLQDRYATMQEGMAAAERWTVHTGIPIFDRESAARAALPPRDPTSFFQKQLDHDGNPPWRAERRHEDSIFHVVNVGTGPAESKETATQEIGTGESAFGLGPETSFFQSLSDKAAQRGAEAEHGAEHGREAGLDR